MNGRSRRWLVWGAAVLTSAAATHAQTLTPHSGPLAPAWQEAATFLYNDAYASFRHAKGQPGVDERERLLGEAITVLNIQPRTAGNIDQARGEFEQIIATNADDEAGIFARYFLARVHQCYEDPPRLDEAARIYRQLLAEHSGHPMAEAGAATFVMMELYEDIAPEERARRFEQLEQIGPQLKTSSGRRDYHIGMGVAYQEYLGSGPKSLEHFLAADAEGITRWQTESIAWVSIAEEARAEGRNDIAVTYYKKFLAKYQHDNRHYTVAQRLASLQAGAQN